MNNHKDGGLRTLLEKGKPVYGSDGTPLALDGLIQEQTNDGPNREALWKADRAGERKIRAHAMELEEANEVLRARNEKLERSNRDLQEFALVASHDLKEPLRKISTFCNFLKVHYKNSLGEQGEDYLERIENAANRMSTLVGAILNYSRVAVEKEPFRPVDLTEAAEEALLNLEVRLRETAGRVSVDKMPVIQADRPQIVQLFQNLIDNALKFHRDDTPPVVRIRADPVNSTSGPQVREGETCRVHVEDNGSGFDERYRDQIFAPLQCLHGRGKYGGSGMGLAVCKRIVERHGGEIKAESNPGEGARFIISLPVAQIDLQVPLKGGSAAESQPGK